ncbi:hypothetical protein [Flavobacterium ardleyense]|uniref:hypothetical protein n=1 Tax=Flavobacterium ardleyense TaxID=2038737 RepID=UPI00298C4ABB|nr:hypothetical protein [Flavobacterium ardleyense]
MKQINWLQIKESLKENFIEQDFTPYITFSHIDIDSALEVFKYILDKKTSNHNETKAVLEALQAYADGEQNKDVLDKLVINYEQFAKKILHLVGEQYTPPARNNPSAPALGWCYKKLFEKLDIPIARSEITEFYAKTLDGKTETPNFDSSHFLNFLTDLSPHGKSLHSIYHLRNSQIHNGPAILTRLIPNLILECINSYLYFNFKFYDELSNSIPASEMLSPLSVEIKNLASLSGGVYQINIENEVLREGIIQTIENKLKKVNVLYLEGSEGIGKTIVLHQFIAKHPNSCFSHFIDGRDKSTYTTLSILQTFCNQIYFFNKNTELSENTGLDNMLDEAYLKKYFNSVNLKSSNNKFLYFILDGFDEINEESQMEIKEQILDFIPYNRENIKLILTGVGSNNIIPDRINSDNWEISSLSSEESKTIFGKNIKESDFRKINEICKNNAGKIVFIRELIKTGDITIENITQNITNDINQLFTYLWNKYYDKNIDYQGLILAIVAFEGEKYSVDKISKIIIDPKNVLTEDRIKEILNNIPFVRRNLRGTYEFLFEELTIFARKKLINYKKVIDGVIIDYLISNSTSKEALVNLPEIYKESGKIDDLIKLLAEERWKQLLGQSESISDVIRVSTTALQAINEHHENKYIPTILKYAILKSSLKELNQTSIWQNEIAANLSLGDEISAINLANIAFLKEDRLKLFASIAKTYTQKGKEVPASIDKKIVELYTDIDFRRIGIESVEIASLLMYSNSKLAFQLIEDMSGNMTDNDNAFDWALAQISLSAYKDLKESEDVSKEDLNAKIYSKIRNPKIKELSNAILYLSENQSLEEITVKIKELESTSQKLFLIRNWILNNRDNENISNIIELGIELVVNKSDMYVPKANDFKIFSIPLPYIKDREKTFELIKKIEQYLVSIEFSSSTNDILNIQLLIAQSLCNFDFEEGEKKLSSIYEEICQITDLALKASCLAIYASAATKIKLKFPEKEIHIYADSALDDIINCIDNILNQTAEHFEIVQGIVTNLVTTYPNAVLDICLKLNKSIDRDNALLEASTRYLKQDFAQINIVILDDLLSNIFDLDIRKIAIHEIITRINSADTENILPVQFHKYFKKVDEIIDNESKCSLYITLISILEKEKGDSTSIAAKLKLTWSELETAASKIELGFEIAYKASFLENKSLAKEFLELARQEKERPELLLDSPNTAQVFQLCIELALKLFSGLIAKNNYNDTDISNLESLISSLPSESQQLQMWTLLILKIAPKSDEVLPKKLINLYVIPKLSKIKNKGERISIILEIIPVLYFIDGDLSILEELPSAKLKDIALSNVCKFLLTKCIPNELCDDNDLGFPLTFETLKKILALISKMSNDYFISYQIDELRKSITSSKSKISSQQIIEVKKIIEKIADEKLPDSNNIKHNGYKILVKAYAVGIQKQPKKEEWDTILSEIDDVPNLSDKIFLWISISSIIPSRIEYGTLKQNLIKDAHTAAYTLPSFLDTVGRVSMIFNSLNSKNVEGINLKTLLVEFLDEQKLRNINPNLRSKYLNILDVAYSADPTIAKVFINMFDTDPARKNTGTYLNNHLNFLEFQSKMNQKFTDSLTERSIIEQKPNYFERIMDKKLARLNATSKPDDELTPKDLLYQLNLASNSSIYVSHNAFSYFIERLIIKYENTDESEKLIKKSFFDLIEICKIIKLLSIRNADKIKSLLDVMSDDFVKDEIEDLEIVKSKIGEKIYNNIVILFSKDLSSDEISEMLDVDLKAVETIKLYI